MSVEPPTSPQPEPAPPPASNRRPLLVGLLALLIIVLLILIGANLLGRTATPPPTGTPQVAAGTATEPGTSATGTPLALAATETPPLPTETEILSLPTGIAIGGGTPGLPGAVPSVAGGGLPTGIANLPGAVPSTQASGVASGTVAAGPGGGTPGTAGPEAATGSTTPGALGLVVVDSSGTAYACARLQGCDLQAAPGLPVYAGGEARTGPAGRLRLQTPAGLLTLDNATTLRVTALDNTQAAILLQQGRVLERAAAGRQQTLLVATASATISGTGTSFGVVLLPAGGVRVAVPADATRPVHVAATAGGTATDVAPGMELTVSATGALGQAAPITPVEAGALADLSGEPAGTGTPVAAIPITELPVPSQPPFPTGVATATMVLTPPPAGTLPPLTVLPVETSTGTAVAGGATGTATGPAGTSVAGAAGTPTSAVEPPSPTTVPTPGSLAATFSTAATVMGGLPSYTFGATRGADPATAEFSAGSVAGDTACWTATAGAVRSDFQVRGGLVFQRAPGGAWQQQAGQTGLPAWLTYWKLLSQADPAMMRDLGTTSTTPVAVRHLRARLLPTAGLGANTWLDAFVTTPDYLVQGLVLSDANPDAGGKATFKVTYSSFGSAPECPPLNP